MNNSLTFASVHARARGRWSEILAALSIDPNALRNRHGPCPGCGGRDRFRFDDRKIGRFYCSGGGADPVSGDGFGLLQHVYGWTAREALERVAQSIGMGGGVDPVPITPRRASPKPPEPSRTAAYALELWRAARTDDAVVGTHPYAISKGITWAAGAGRVIVPKGKIVGDGADCLVIPIRAMDWRVIAVQAINASGAKQTFGPMGDDGCLLLGNMLDRAIPWVIVEGWADAVSLVFHIYRGNAVAAAAFGINRMDRTARAIADHYQPNEIVILEDAA
jgi:phage/plasmid primase-like uncharacterized protein